VFSRSKPAPDSAPALRQESDLGGKGRRTPTRKEAEAARRLRMKPPTTRKEAAKIARQRRNEGRAQARAGMATGDERYLPARDRGPVRRFSRDFVDSRRGVAEYLMPILVVVLLLSVVNTPWAVRAVFAVWALMIVGSVLDTVYLVISLKRALKRVLPGENAKGASTYAVLRSTQLRRFRLPKPQVARGEKPVAHR